MLDQYDRVVFSLYRGFKVQMVRNIETGKTRIEIILKGIKTPLYTIYLTAEQEEALFTWVKGG